MISYTSVIEKRITPKMLDQSLSKIVGKRIINAKIVIMYNHSTEDGHESNTITSRIKKLSQKTAESGLRFSTSKEAMEYLNN